MNYFVHPERAKENVAGAFYTVDIGCDCACGIPEAIAPSLLATTEDRRYQTYFYKQPETDAELTAAIEAIASCGIHNIRYGGINREIIKRIRAEQCDYRVNWLGCLVLKS